MIEGIDKAEVVKLFNRFKNDVEFFGYYFFPHLLNRRCASFHSEIYKDLLKPQFYACAAPRGHAKSTIGLIVKPIHYSIFDGTGDITLLSASESFIVNEITRRIKSEFENNERMKAFFGNMVTKKWAETYFIINNSYLGRQVSFEAAGIGGQLRGGRRGLIALDDLESNESVESEDQRTKLRNRVNKELVPKLLPDGQMIYFGTIISPLCYLKAILDTPDNGWKKKTFKAYVDGIQEAGHELWAEMLPHEELQKRKRVIGTNAFNSEYMNTPVTDETAAIKESQIRYWTELPAQLSAVITVDPAYSEDPKADYKVATVIGIDQNLNRYLLAYLRTHQPSGEYIDGILNLYLQYRHIITGVGIPSAGTEKEFYKSVVNKSTERKIYPPFIELKNTFITATGEAKRSKNARIIAALQPLFEAGKYYINASHLEAREELLLLTARGEMERDDLIDAMAYAEQILTPSFYDTQTQNNKQSNMAGKSADYGIEY